MIGTHCVLKSKQNKKKNKLLYLELQFNPKNEWLITECILGFKFVTYNKQQQQKKTIF